MSKMYFNFACKCAHEGPSTVRRRGCAVRVRVRVRARERVHASEGWCLCPATAGPATARGSALPPASGGHPPGGLSGDFTRYRVLLSNFPSESGPPSTERERLGILKVSAHTASRAGGEAGARSGSVFHTSGLSPAFRSLVPSLVPTRA